MCHFHTGHAKRFGGFTIIELLASIAILAVLVVLISIGIRHVLKLSQNAECVSNLHNLGHVNRLYMLDNDNNMPPMRLSLASDSRRAGWYWYDHLHEYIGRNSGFSGRFPQGSPKGNPWWCPSIKPMENPSQDRRYTYGINVACGHEVENYAKMGSRYLGTRIVPNPGRLSSTAWFADVRSNLYFGGSTQKHVEYLDWPHNNHSNVLYMDGHVGSVANPEFESHPALLNLPEWQEFFASQPE